jgi:hypothetical protein
MERRDGPPVQTRARHRRRNQPAARPPSAGSGHRSAEDSQGHGHGHGPVAPADRRVRIAIAALLVPCALAP